MSLKFKTKKKEGVLMKCPNHDCDYIWTYNGRFVFYATCPSCRRNIKISDNKIESPRSAQVTSHVQTATLQSTTVGADALGQ